jgi:hypothetical protein
LLSVAAQSIIRTPMTERLIAALKRAFSIRVERIAFRDNLYHDEDFVAKSVAINFAGWYFDPGRGSGKSLQNLRISLKRGGTLFVELDNRRHFIKNQAGERYWNYHRDRWPVLSEHHYDPVVPE